jgi:hypothetical protein
LAGVVGRRDQVDHVVYVDAGARELEKLIQGTKTMIVRGACEMEVPYGRVSPGDTIYFVDSKEYSDRLVCAKAVVKDVLNVDTMTHVAAAELLQAYQSQLQLTKKEIARWVRRRYLVLITVENVIPVPPFSIDRSNYGGADDWLPVGDIQRIVVRSSSWLRGKRFYKDADLTPSDWHTLDTSSDGWLCERRPARSAIVSSQ